MKPLITLMAVSVMLLSLSTKAQLPVSKIIGKIVQADQQPVNAATISLLVAGNTQPVKFEVSATDGSFSFEDIRPGIYTIVATAVGHLKYESAPFTIDSSNNQTTLPVFIMSKADIELKEVAVTAKKSFIEQKIDRTVVNVDAMISNAGTTALEVLEKAPGVRVDPNGTISLKGQQGVTIFIDDKPSYLSGADLQNYLRSLPSSTLAQVEIMTNPPAKYDAAGNGGIINIKTVKKKIQGFNMGINLSPRFSKYTSVNNSLDFNYRHNKFNFFGNFAYGTRNNYNDISITRKYKNEDGSLKDIFTQDSYIRRKGYGVKATVGADFYASENTTLGITFDNMIRYPKNTNTSTGQIYDSKMILDSSVVSINNEDGKFKSHGVNFNIKHDFYKNGPSILANFDYLTYDINNDQIFSNKSYSPEGVFKSEDKLDGNLPTDIKIYSGKVDYSQTFKGDWKFEAGAKSSYTNTSNIANYFNTIGGITSPDYEKTNNFSYKENINAGYVNLNKDFNRLSVQLGLRLETTSSKGHQLGNLEKPDSAFARNYTNIFPTVFLMYSLDSLSDHQLKFNFGRRIDRPYYQDLNPFISPLDKFSYYTGNPYLQPSLSTKVELGYIFKNKLTATASYTNTKDQVFETIEIIDNTYYSRPGNIGKTKLYTLDLGAGLDPTPWFTFQINAQLNYFHSKGNFYTGLLDTKSTYLYTQGMAQFKLKKNWIIQLDGYYQTKMTNVQFELAARGRLNAAVAKVLSPKATLKFSVSDILFTNINKGTITNLQLTDAYFKTLSDSRAAILTLSLRFGKAVKGQRKHNSTGADTESNRVKN
ncbi:TonB-dependent receptor [Chitinophaga sancti]|uniref:TonB-dependent receptor n=1 Tax=Chitinophaga sancti TaxID=1004 RepID=UPI002A759A7D|nr:TonB-dependent receptor [Chitinophaga sancti]WPQ62337.1 TonB-dependent receptor [Chitinophaga sancti]